MKGKGILTFLGGALVGSAITYFGVKAYYDSIIEDEIESVRDILNKSRGEKKEESGKDSVVEKDPNDLPVKTAEEYREKLQKYKPSSGEEVDLYVVEDAETNEEIYDEIGDIEPFVITSETFGTIEDYECISLTFFEDEVLTDDDFLPIYEVEDIVGEGIYELFRDGADEVYIRNNRLRADYEITRDLRSYIDIQNNVRRSFN